MSSVAGSKPKANGPMAVFGLACVGVAVAVLAGATDITWVWGAWTVPLLLIALGVATLTRLVRGRPR
ncbi:MAG: hypothetical protein QOJ19_3861 [Acidimicrobiia bacterium]|nr:hypothetical protein [Acidimicrobiia bacterium]